jgi:uncharacterized membrane protein YvlD (DUF360 family)
MKTKIFWVTINLFLFWVVSDLLSGIVVLEGVVGHIVCGILFGVAMLIVIPVIKFFTLPIKFITLFLISILVSIIFFFILQVTADPFITFMDGELMGFSNNFFELPYLAIGTTWNVVIGGILCGFFSSLVSWLDTLD